MKRLIVVGVIAVIASLIACKKDSFSGDATILGKWTVITDSSFTGVGINNHPVGYNGQEGDYFDFRAGGILYIAEGNALDTLSYTLVSNTSIIIESFGFELNGVPEKSAIAYLVPNAIKITSPLEITPGGVFGRTVVLKR